VWRAAARLPATGALGQPPGSSPASAGRRPRSGGRRRPGAFGANPGGLAGGDEERRCLPATGYRLPGRAPGLHGRGLGDGLAHHRERAAGPRAGTGRPAARAARCRRPGSLARNRPRVAGAAGQPGLPDLHLGLDRPTERRGRAARATEHALPGHCRAVRDGTWRARAALHVVRLRRRARTLADHADGRWHAGDSRWQSLDPGADLPRAARAAYRHRLFPAGLPQADGRVRRGQWHAGAACAHLLLRW